MKLIQAFQRERVSDSHFAWNTGYGYDDAGREVTEKVFARAFSCDKALVRTNIVSGTHALAISLLGLLRPGEELLYLTGRPYDTLQDVIGIRNRPPGSLADMGVTYKEIPLLPDGQPDYQALAQSLTPQTRLIALQRSCGYAWRPSLSVAQLEEACTRIHRMRPDLIVMVDNSYGEFVEEREPVACGADIMAGSLIKNPGGGLALAGAYVAGRKDLVDRVAFRMTCPGIGAECGLTYGQTRAILQGFFLAPKVVSDAVKGSLLLAEVYKTLGYPVSPEVHDHRTDIVQAIRLGSAEAVSAFCQGIQQAAVVDSFVSPVPSPMPGYDCDIIMAAGTFVQGASIELSADAPMREPYNVYFQGGLTYPHAKFGVIKSLDALQKQGLLKGVR